MTKETVVSCPRCKVSNNHILSVQTFIGDDNPRLTKKDILILPNGNLQYFNSPRIKSYRLNGMSILIKYKCEQGHFWSEELYNHKGHSFKSIIIEEREQHDS